MRHWLMFAGGLLLCAAATAHFTLGWPAMRAPLVAAGVDPEIVAGMGVGWTFGSVAMLAFGLIALRDALRLRADPGAAVPGAQLAGLAYALFGLGALFYRTFNPHFLGFIVIGLLVALPALLPRRAGVP